MLDGIPVVVLVGVTATLLLAGALSLGYAVYVEGSHRNGPTLWGAAVVTLFAPYLPGEWWNLTRYGVRTEPLAREEIYARTLGVATILAVVAGALFPPLYATVPVATAVALPPSYWFVTRQQVQARS